MSDPVLKGFACYQALPRPLNGTAISYRGLDSAPNGNAGLKTLLNSSWSQDSIPHGPSALP
jgi:hypothetical protein